MMTGIKTATKTTLRKGLTDGPDLLSVIYTNLPAQVQTDLDWWISQSYTIYENGTTTFSMSGKKHSGTTVYVSQTGDDANDGLTLVNAKKTITSAVLVSGVDIIELTSGRHHNILTHETDFLSDITVCCSTGTAEIVETNEDDSSNFTSDSGVYKWTGAGTIYSVWDEANTDAGYDDYWGYLPEEGSLVDLQASGGGWYSDGTDLYVKTTDNRAPDEDIRIDKTREFYYTGQSTSGWNYYENIKFHGFMIRTAGGSSNVVAYFNNCEFAYSGNNQNAAFNNSGGIVYLSGCKAHSSYSDCFTLRGAARTLELNCTAHRTLKSGSNNGSTTHGTSSPVRINSTYSDVSGDVIGDISDNATLMVNCTAVDSTGGAAYGDFRYDINGSGMVLINCNDTGSTSDNSKNGDGTVYEQGLTLEAGLTVESPSPIETVLLA